MSGETKFTSGPWRIEPPHNHEGGDGFSILREDLHEVEWVAEVGWEADAHLIAASPDMYGMLNHLREYFDNRADADQPFGAPQPIPNLEMEYLMEIDEVLAAARGEPQ